MTTDIMTSDIMTTDIMTTDIMTTYHDKWYFYHLYRGDQINRLVTNLWKAVVHAKPTLINVYCPNAGIWTKSWIESYHGWDHREAFNNNKNLRKFWYMFKLVQPYIPCTLVWTNKSTLLSTLSSYPKILDILPSSAQAPAKLGWVALFAANPTTPTHPGKFISQLQLA